MQKKDKTGYPSIDKPWLKYYSEEAINVTFPKATVYASTKITVPKETKLL